MRADAAAQERFRLGVNYWPALSAMGWLKGYSPEVTRSDFRRCVRAGLSTIRVFLRWEDAQPAPDRIDAGVLAHLVDAADAAAEVGAELIVTLFVGHMSGVNYAPAWATAAGPPSRFRTVSASGVVGSGALRNWYHDAAIVDAQQRLALAAATALAGHPSVWAWDLGNENSNCTVPADRAAGRAWLERMTAAVRAADPGRPITIGLHMEDLEEDRMIGPAEAAEFCDFACMHGYPIYAGWSAGPTDAALVGFLAAITRWLSGGLPVLFEEFGLPTNAGGEALPVAIPMTVSEDVAATYTGAALDSIWREGCLGALLWCFSDYAPELHGLPPLDLAPHERGFGLWRADGTPKLALSEISARSGRRVVGPGPTTWLDISIEEFVANRPYHLGRLYGAYRGIGDAGAREFLPEEGLPGGLEG